VYELCVSGVALKKSAILRRRRLLKDDNSGFLVILNEVENLGAMQSSFLKGLLGD
jgi:hypothetical protein